MGNADGWVTARTGNSVRTEITTGTFELVSDEPEDLGGNDDGPTPYDYLMGALGACTSMTVRMYADRKDWPLESVTTRLRHRKVHAEDCAECETQRGRIDFVEREVELEGPLDEEQRHKLLDIADKCPVHRTLESEVRIETRLVGPDEDTIPE